MPLGMLYAAEFYNCRNKKAFHHREVERAACASVRAAGLTVIRPVKHRYEPHGVTCIVLLKESHIAVHTWPEHDFVAADIFTCGHASRARKALTELRRVYRPTKVIVKKFVRGSLVRG